MKKIKGLLLLAIFTFSMATTSAQGIRIFGINIFSGCGGAPYQQCQVDVQAANDAIFDAGGFVGQDVRKEAARDCKQERRDCRRN